MRYFKEWVFKEKCTLPDTTEFNSNHSHLTFPDVNSVVHYQMINHPSTITKHLLLIPQVSSHSACRPFLLHLNSCTYSMEVGDLPFWALLHTFHSASFWLATIIPLSSHTHGLFCSVSDLYGSLCLLHTHFPTSFSLQKGISHPHSTNLSGVTEAYSSPLKKKKIMPKSYFFSKSFFFPF